MNKNIQSIRNTVIVGIVIVFVAALFIVGMLIIPGIAAKSAFDGQLDKLADSPIDVATVYSPDITVGQLGQKGKEVTVADTEGLRLLFLELARDTEFASSQSNLGISDFDFRVRFKTVDKKVFDFFLSGNQIFRVDGDGMRYYFNIKNTEVGSSFTQMLSELLDDNK